MTAEIVDVDTVVVGIGIVPAVFHESLAPWFSREKDGSPSRSGIYQTQDERGRHWFNRYVAENNIWKWGFSDLYNAQIHSVRDAMSVKEMEESVINWRGLNKETT